MGLNLGAAFSRRRPPAPAPAAAARPAAEAAPAPAAGSVPRVVDEELQARIREAAWLLDRCVRPGFEAAPRSYDRAALDLVELESMAEVVDRRTLQWAVTVLTDRLEQSTWLEDKQADAEAEAAALGRPKPRPKGRESFRAQYGLIRRKEGERRGHPVRTPVQVELMYAAARFGDWIIEGESPANHPEHRWLHVAARTALKAGVEDPVVRLVAADHRLAEAEARAARGEGRPPEPEPEAEPTPEPAPPAASGLRPPTPGLQRPAGGGLRPPGLRPPSGLVPPNARS